MAPSRNLGLVLLASLVCGRAGSGASDLPLPGTILRLERAGGREKLLLVLNDPDIPVPAQGSPDNPAATAGLRVVLFGHDVPGEIAEVTAPPGLGRPGWKYGSTGFVRYRFRNGAAPGGPSPVRSVGRAARGEGPPRDRARRRARVGSATGFRRRARRDGFDPALRALRRERRRPRPGRLVRRQGRASAGPGRVHRRGTLRSSMRRVGDVRGNVSRRIGMRGGSRSRSLLLVHRGESALRRYGTGLQRDVSGGRTVRERGRRPVSGLRLPAGRQRRLRHGPSDVR
jgi:hypothetical protein